MNAKSKDKPDTEMIRSLAKLLDETGLSEIEYSTGGTQVRVARISQGAPVTMAAPAAPSTAADTSSSSSPASPAAEDLTDHPGALLSPMVGVVYTSPEPGLPPFARVGDQVSKGQTLLLIEAMKVFNPIVAPISGTLARVLVSSGAPVEFNEPLAVIE